jgi:hypothetical protein
LEAEGFHAHSSKEGIRMRLHGNAALSWHELLADHPTGISLTALGRQLSLDKSVVSRRARDAAARGYLRNDDDRRGKPTRYVLGDPLPAEVEVLPSREQLECCTVADEKPRRRWRTPPARHRRD